jgi:hypothetical protein
MNAGAMKGLAGIPAVVMVVLLFLSAYFGWWGLFQTVATAMIIGAVIGAVVAAITKEVAAVPVIGGFAGIVGIVLHVIIRLQVWFG